MDTISDCTVMHYVMAKEVSSPSVVISGHGRGTYNPLWKFHTDHISLLAQWGISCTDLHVPEHIMQLYASSNWSP